MQPYNQLTFAGRLRRLRDLAAAALANYDLKISRLDYYAFETNLFYQVTSTSGERFMLRLASPGWRTFTDLRSEALWLDALSRETTIPVPRLLPTRSGEPVNPVTLAGIPQAWNASLMTWVPGRLLGHYLSGPNLEKMGSLFAGLHHHAAAWIPPAGFTTRRFEHWLSRGEENKIVDWDPAPGAPPQPANIIEIPAHLRDLLNNIHCRVEAAYAALDRSDLQVIHCDLWHDNIKLHHGKLHPIDFEDTVWGFCAHDIAMAMLDLLEFTGEERYPGLLAAFRRGYTAHLAWPTSPIEPFQVGRLLWMINWVARHQPQRLVDRIERYVPVFEHYQRTGKVILPLRNDHPPAKE